MEVSGQLHAPAALTTEKSPSTYWTGGCVGPGTDVGAVAKRKSTYPRPEPNPGRPSRCQAITPNELPEIFVARTIHLLQTKI
jgi:hypothetical protein